MIEFVRSATRWTLARARIWPYVDDVTRWPEWFTEAERCEVLEGDGVGRRQRMYGHARGKATEIDSVDHASTRRRCCAGTTKPSASTASPGRSCTPRMRPRRSAIVPDGSGRWSPTGSMAEPGSLRQHVHAPGPRAEADRTSFETSLARLAALAEAPG